MSDNLKSRLKNYGLWISAASFVLLILQNFGISVVESEYNNIVNSFLGLLVLLGIISNPTTTSSGYTDDKESNTNS